MFRKFFTYSHIDPQEDPQKNTKKNNRKKYPKKDPQKNSQFLIVNSGSLHFSGFSFAIMNEFVHFNKSIFRFVDIVIQFTYSNLFYSNYFTKFFQRKS